MLGMRLHMHGIKWFLDRKIAGCDIPKRRCLTFIVRLKSVVGSVVPVRDSGKLLRLCIFNIVNPTFLALILLDTFRCDGFFTGFDLNDSEFVNTLLKFPELGFHADLPYLAIIAMCGTLNEH